MTQINYANISYAVSAYRRMGYHYIEVPWWVSPHTAAITRPPEASEDNDYYLPTNQKTLVASGEQAFLYLAAKGQLTLGVDYVTVTPCFRNEQQWSANRKHFMKCELFCLRSSSEQALHRARAMRNHAYEVLQEILGEQVAVVDCPGPVDHELALPDLGIRNPRNTEQFVELGSYGARNAEGMIWAYGTGLAEPRTSYAQSLVVADSQRPMS